LFCHPVEILLLATRAFDGHWADPGGRERGCRMPVCAICGIDSPDLLRHLRLEHGVTSAEEYERAVISATERKEQVKGYRDFIRELTKLREGGKITAEDFRQRSDAWLDANGPRRRT
jgi:hypothetical protein